MSPQSTCIENEVRDYLISNQIYPFLVIYVSECNLLKISFCVPEDIEEFIKVSGISKVCDNSGLQVYSDTILLSGAVLHRLFKNVTEHQGNN